MRSLSETQPSPRALWGLMGLAVLLAGLPAAAEEPAGQASDQTEVREIYVPFSDLDAILQEPTRFRLGS